MLKLGWGVREITPPREAMIMGQMDLRVGAKARDPLLATALALEDGGENVILISLDLAYPTASLIEAVRRGVAARLPGVSPDRVILTATHTHDGPVLEDGSYDYPGGDCMTPAECCEWVAARIVEAAAEAWESRRARLLERAFGHAVVGHNRMAVYADGHGQMYGRTDRSDFIGFSASEDHSMDMLFVWEADGSLSGLLLAIPCPSQVEEHLTEFSADYWHEVRTELRARLGTHVTVLGLCSPAGDQSPHFLLYKAQEAEMRRRRGLSERQEIARRVARGVLEALECTRPSPDKPWPLAHRSRTLTLPGRKITRAERDLAEKIRSDWIKDKGESQSWWPRWQQVVVDCFEDPSRVKPVPAEVHVMRIGEVALATNPFELYLDYGLRIKARSPASQTMLAQLAGRGFYLPTARAVAHGGYSVMPAVAPAGPEGGDMLVEETLKMIGELFPPPGRTA